MTLLDYRTPTPLASDATIPRGHWLGWSIYVAMSWTWCIGMFLPVLLIRDFGIPGFLTFAIPNVLGAAAMGWILPSARVSRDVATTHRAACLGFSLVTIAFHVFFCYWVVLPLLGPMIASLAIVIAVVTFVLVRSDDRRAIVLAVGTLIFSVGLGTLGLINREFPYLRIQTPVQPANGLPSLSLICLFGLMLCPYLDLTFHRGRQRTSIGGGRAAFTVGFGVFFSAMLLFTLAYSGWLKQWLDRSFEAALPPLIAGLIGAHLMVQSALTAGFHAREVVPRTANALVLLAFVVAAIAGLVRFPFLVFGNPRYPNPTTGEFVYRAFMGFYGLVFPAYVWLCMIPGRGRVPPNRQQLSVFAIAVVMAAPMFWLGFIEGRMFWLLPGLAIVLLARLLIPRRHVAT